MRVRRGVPLVEGLTTSLKERPDMKVRYSIIFALNETA
jgi:hypothetical protein